MDEREKRIGENEALFREVNERIEDASWEGQVDLLCECVDVECTKTITLTLKTNEKLRADPTTFAILPGHGELDVEEIVERYEDYLVVRKHEGGPAEVAEARDPRS
ncbi:MAG TPA: hypothetical protein VHK22_03175 [Gaiellaceae bacterium]|nr:hypothetical protein [Gaiellaceae bacterium]